MQRLVILAGCFWFGMWLLASPAVSTAATADTARLPNSLISPEDEVEVPAQEPGVLKDLPVREGQQVKKGDLLAQIDDMIPQAKVDVAQAKLQAARAEAASDVAKRYAVAAAATAWADYRQSEDANGRVQGSVTQERVREQLLKAREMDLTIEKADKDHLVAVYQAEVAAAELKAAVTDRDHRRITSAQDGEVVELSRHVGEWVQAGDPLMRVVRLDKLRVDAIFNARNYLPSELQDQPVSITVELAHGKNVTFPGKVVFVKPVADAGGLCRVRALVENRKENGFWVLRPGLLAEMDIQLK